MPSGRHKSKTFRKVFVRTPGGNTAVHHRRRKPSKAHCASCKTQLAGVPRELPSQLKKIPKTQRRPERPFGGQLCSGCMRTKIKSQVRQ
ncbi:MAG: 50S ribosomal protein L34e [Nanoarchaeota archaeon]|nr:50S ribosomal protein L34e [Nanoarchaeota archaeon]